MKNKQTTEERVKIPIDFLVGSGNFIWEPTISELRQILINHCDLHSRVGPDVLARDIFISYIQNQKQKKEVK